MYLDFFNVDEFCKDLKPISNAKVYAKNDIGFDRDGLFSEMIFGPVRTATCACGGGTYWGRGRIGDTCQTCGIDITYSSERRKRFAKIELPFAILNPIMYHILVKAGKNKMKEIMDNLLSDDKTYGYYYSKEQERFVRIERLVKEKESDEEQIPEFPDDTEIYTGIEGLHNIVARFCEIFHGKDKIWDFIGDNLDKFYMNNIIVPPPEIRPVSKTKDAQMRDEMNKFYMTILNFSLTLKDDHLGTDNLEGISQITFKELQKHTFELYDYIFKKFSKKSGLIRGSILGRRTDFSGRAVISPDPSLKLGECSIPYVMALELYKLDIANVLIEKRKYKRYDSALTYIDRCIELEDLALFEIVSNVVIDGTIILNRQPTLHRMGLLAFTPKVNKDYVIKIHPFVCEPYNADFDGDQMALYRPLYDEAIKESKEKLHVLSNLVCPTTGGLMLGVNQDTILGIYMLTSPDEEQKVVYEGIDTYKGRVVFNQCFPDYPFINETITKKKLAIFLDDITRTHSSEEVADTLDKIKDLGFKFTTMMGSTMSLKDMHLDNAKEITDPIFDHPDDDLSNKISKLQGKDVMEKVKETFPYSVFIESGSRGSWDQANQIILARGYVSNFKGEIQPEPVRNCLMEGLTRKEFFTSCHGSRKGLLDTALNTGVSGYLTRKLIYCTSNLELDPDCDDCGTTDLMPLKIPATSDEVPGITPMKMAKGLIGKYATIKNKEFLVTYDNYHTLIGKKIKIRSIVFCKNYNVCKKCYGESYKTLHSTYVGIIAAQALGEVSTQLVLRSFHTSGIAQTRKGGDKTDKQQDISNDLQTVNKVFHNSTPLYFMGEKFDKLSYLDSLLCLYRVYSRYKTMLFVQYECVISQMMRSGKNRWRLSEERDLSKVEMVSLESVPARESWLLALAFSKVKTYLVDGVVGNDVNNGGILEKIMVNEKL